MNAFSFLARSRTTYFISIDVNGRIILANDLLQQTIPAYAKGAPGSSVTDMVLPADHPGFIEAIEKCFSAETTEPFNIHFRLHIAGYLPTLWTAWEFTLIAGNGTTPPHISGIGHAVPVTYTEKELANSVIDSLPCVFFLQDECGNYLKWNHAFESVSGYSGEEIKSLHPLVFFDKKDHERILTTINDVLEQGSGSIEAEVITKHKEVIPYFFNGRAVTYEGKRCIIGTGIDYSEQSKAQEQSRLSKEKYHLLFQQATDCIHITDYNGNFIDANDAMLKMFGYTKEELLTMNISCLIDAKQLAGRPIRFDKLVAGEHVFSQRTMVHKNGTLIYVEANVKKFGEGMIMAIARDITQRKIMEENLERSEKNLRHVLSSSAENFYMINRHYRVELINETAERNLQKDWGKTVLPGANILDLIPTNTEEPIKASFDKALAGEKVEYELYTTLHEGPVWVLVSFMPVTNEDGVVTGVYVVTKNITERRESEHEKEDILYKLNERVKELTTLYRFGQILEKDDGSVIEVMQKLVTVLPPGWQYPDITAARIVLGNKETRTANFAKGPHKQKAPFRTQDGTEGLLEVIYLEERPRDVEGAFFAEERNMINMLAEMFRTYLNRKTEAEILKKSEANLNTIFNSTDSVYVLMDTKFQIISYNKPAIEFAAKELKHTIRISDGFLDYFPLDRQSALLGQLKRALSGAYVNYEATYPQPDGSVNWYDVRVFAISGTDGETFGIMMAVLDVTEKKLLEQEILDQKVQEQKRITRAMIKAQEKERNHIGQELHDNVNQILAGTKIYLMRAGQNDEKVKELLQYPMELIDSSINEIRQLSGRQVTPLRNIDLQELICSLLKNLSGCTSVKTVFSYNLPGTLIDDDLKLNIYRIMQEQVNNILKHAHAQNVGICIEADKDNRAINISITDDGKGFDPRQKRNGIGISNMINRIESFNGEVSINSSPGNGCSVQICIPYFS